MQNGTKYLKRKMQQKYGPAPTRPKTTSKTYAIHEQHYIRSRLLARLKNNEQVWKRTNEIKVVKGIELQNDFINRTLDQIERVSIKETARCLELIEMPRWDRELVRWKWGFSGL